MDKKQDHLHVTYKRLTPDVRARTDSKEMEKHIPCKRKPKESRGSYTYIRQIDSKTKTIIRDKEGHYIMIKGSITLGVMTLVNIIIWECFPMRKTLCPNSKIFLFTNLTRLSIEIFRQLLCSLLSVQLVEYVNGLRLLTVF